MVLIQKKKTFWKIFCSFVPTTETTVVIITRLSVADVIRSNVGGLYFRKSLNIFVKCYVVVSTRPKALVHNVLRSTYLVRTRIEKDI